MEVTGTNFNDIFSNNKTEYIIPFFQRKYVWNEDNWEELIENLTNNKTSFFGSIILKQTGMLPTPNLQQFNVIDGQQRLTTISILFKAMLDVIPDDIQSNQDLKIRSFLVNIDRRASGRKKIKIHHSKYDEKAFNQVILEEINIDEINEESHLIFQCYKFFVKKMEKFLNEDVSKILNIYEKLTDADCVVSITLNSTDNEQIIFNTINNTGVKLTNADTIKNDIFQRALDLCNNNSSQRSEVISIYDRTWGSEFDTDENKVKFWDTITVTGRKMTTHLEKFLYSFATIHKIYDPNKNKVEDLAECYKKHVALLNLQQVKDFIENLTSYANKYFDIWDEYDSERISYDDIYSRLFLIFDKFDTSTFNSYVLYCAKNFSENEAKDKLILLEKYLIKNMILGESVKNYNKECFQMIHGENKNWLKEKLSTTRYSNGQIRKGLDRIKKNNRATLLLFFIELYRRSIGGYTGETELSYKYTLEHLMPQTWQTYWNVNTLGVYDEITGEKIVDEEEAKNVRQDHVYRLGNMTLLSKKMNSSIKNREFEIKMNGSGRVLGIKNLSNLSISTDVIHNFESGDHVWNEKKIRDRTSKLYEDIIKIWPE